MPAISFLVIIGFLLSCAAKKEAKKAARRGCEVSGSVTGETGANFLRNFRFASTRPGTATIGTQAIFVSSVFSVLEGSMS